eukprot:6490513-Amphidinium_carterae.1
MTLASVVESKGRNGYVENLLVKWILMLGLSRVQIRMDGEPASVALATALSNRLRKQGLAVSPPQHTLRASHQSVGAVERAHGVLGAFMRTFLSQLDVETGYKPPLHHAVMVWLIRHVAYLRSYFQTGIDGLTPSMRLTGRDVRKRLACYGERVLAQVMQEKRSNKLAPRWTEAVFVGVQEALQGKSEQFIVLTSTGAMLTRTVRRLVATERWDKKLLENARGLPWSVHEATVRPVDLKASAVSLPQLDPEDVTITRTEAPHRSESESRRITPGSNPFVQTSGGTKRRAEAEPASSANVAASPMTTAPPVAAPAPQQQQQQQQHTDMDDIPVPTALATETERPVEQMDVIPVPMEVRGGMTRPADDEGILPESKRGRVAAICAALANEHLTEQMVHFLEHEVEDSVASFKTEAAVVSAIDDLRDYLQETQPQDFFTTRKEEIQKLTDFKLYKPVLRSSIAQSAQVFQPRWVDTERKGQMKSRLTVKDLKIKAKRTEDRQKAVGTYSTDDFQQTQSPTPSGLANRLMMWIAVCFDYPMVSLDVCSAFLHAREASEGICMQPPAEWEIMFDKPAGLYLWELVGNLYGRRTAPAAFRLLFEAIMCRT